MDELRNALHAAAAEPPPTRIDLDELIDGTRRRSRLQYRIGAVAGAVALSTGALLVPMVLLPSGGLSTTGGGAPPNPCPWPSFSPAPVPSGSLGVVAGPSDDPSVPAASRRPSSDPSEPAYPSGSPWFPSGSPSLPASASPWPSPSRFICYPVRPVLRCSVGSPSPSGPPPSRSPADAAVELATCIRLASLHAAAAEAFPSGWELSQTTVIPGPPHGYKSTLVLTKGDSLIEVQLTVANEQPGNVPGRCAALAHGRAGDCKVRQEGDAVLVAGRVVYDVRPDGTTVTAEAGPPATTAQLTTLARSAQLVSVLN